MAEKVIVVQPGRGEGLGVPEGPLWGRLQRAEAVTLEDGRTIEPGLIVGSPRPGREGPQGMQRGRRRVPGTARVAAACGIPASPYSPAFIPRRSRLSRSRPSRGRPPRLPRRLIFFASAARLVAPR